jgi:hypothetical protein
MKRMALTLALMLVLTSANSSQACDWLFGCGCGCPGGWGISLGLCGLSIGYEDLRSNTYAGCCCGSRQGCGTGTAIGMASSFEQWPGRNAALQAMHARTRHNGTTPAARTRTLVVDLQSFDFESPKVQVASQIQKTETQKTNRSLVATTKP